MNESSYRRNDLTIKILGVFLTVSALIIGQFQYFHTLSSENELEFRRNIWTKQIHAYSEACKYAGLISTSTNNEAFNRNVQEFNSLYWGEMMLVEDSIVEAAMRGFYYAIIDYSKEDSQTRRKLKFKARQLADACRESSKQTWLVVK